MVENDSLRYTKIALNNGSGAIPALGFGTLIPDPLATRTATKAALEVGFRQLDASERYRNEKEVGEAVQDVLKAGKIKREDVFVATKLWNNNHRPERVKTRLRGQSQETPTRLRRSLSALSATFLCPL
jgi:diketogulonate reductase-like aldo/keto reductase